MHGIFSQKMVKFTCKEHGIYWFFDNFFQRGFTFWKKTIDNPKKLFIALNPTLNFKNSSIGKMDEITLKCNMYDE